MSRLSATVAPSQCRMLRHHRVPLSGGDEGQQVGVDLPHRPVLVEEGGYSVACEGEEVGSGGTASPAGACSHSESSTSG